MLAAVRLGERVVTVEETFELDPPVDDIVALQCRQPSLEGTGEITLRRLVKESLRMRPDRLIVGEVREAEALDLLVALNCGVSGMCSIHANSARDALGKLTTLPCSPAATSTRASSCRPSRSASTWSCTSRSTRAATAAWSRSSRRPGPVLRILPLA